MIRLLFILLPPKVIIFYGFFFYASGIYKLNEFSSLFFFLASRTCYPTMKRPTVVIGMSFINRMR